MAGTENHITILAWTKMLMLKERQVCFQRRLEKHALVY